MEEIGQDAVGAVPVVGQEHRAEPARGLGLLEHLLHGHIPARGVGRTVDARGRDLAAQAGGLQGEEFAHGLAVAVLGAHKPVVAVAEGAQGQIEKGVELVFGAAEKRQASAPSCRASPMVGMNIKKTRPPGTESGLLQFLERDAVHGPADQGDVGRQVLESGQPVGWVTSMTVTLDGVSGLGQFGLSDVDARDHLAAEFRNWPPGATARPRCVGRGGLDLWRRRPGTTRQAFEALVQDALGQGPVGQFAGPAQAVDQFAQQGRLSAAVRAARRARSRAIRL